MEQPKSRRSGDQVVWTPDRKLIDSCELTRFMQSLRGLTGEDFTTYTDLHNWAVNNPEIFWPELANFLKLRGAGALDPLFANTAGADEPGANNSGPTPLAKRWFPKFSLNFADNLLQAGDDNQTAIVAWSEERLRRTLTFFELKSEVKRVVNFLKDAGAITAGERIFGYLPNIPEAVVSMLAAAKLGASWSSCGTDYQQEGVISRIERLKPKVLVVSAAYLWRGEVRPLNEIIKEIVNRVASIEAVLVIDHLNVSADLSIEFDRKITINRYDSLPQDPESWRDGPLFPFSHPLYILFSSGTTGKPKGIVHTAGGTLLEHRKEHALHSDIRSQDRVFYQTSTSWMMWNWLVSVLASGARILLYEGDPFRENGATLWRMIDSEGVTHFGTAAAYLGELEKRGIEPAKHHKLSELRAIFSTGSSLSPRLFDYVAKSIKPLWLQSISGGTDIVGCFGLGCPLTSVIKGVVQCKSLGYAVRVFNESGQPVIEEQGELVCTAPAPSMPSHFIDDPTGESYRAAYFGDFPGVWRHGDFVLETKDGGLIFGGRSDATLKPGGVRVATADIYAALQRIPEIIQSMAVGYSPPGDEVTEQIVLFVVLRAGEKLTGDLELKIKSILKQENTFFVPKFIFQAPDLPRTPNNKLAELTVKRILKGEDPGNKSALVNPECLGFFEGVIIK
jgi:acetoacetyl-CoA synthetase